MNAFEQYGSEIRGGTHAPRPLPLTGAIKTRGAARKIYADIVTELNACEDQDMLQAYLLTISQETEQFKREIEFLWSGDGADFLGLELEIENAFLRLNEFRDDPGNLWGDGFTPHHQAQEEGLA